MMLTFSSTPGAGGREGLQPLSAWLNVVQEEVAAAKDISAELNIATIWSWGWANFTAAGAIPTRRPSRASTSRATRRSATRRSMAGANLETAPVASPRRRKASSACWHDADPRERCHGADCGDGRPRRRFSAAFQRLMLVKAAPLANGAVAAAELEIINDRFAGQPRELRRGPRSAHATVNIARDVIGDQLRQQEVEADLAHGCADRRLRSRASTASTGVSRRAR